MKVHWFTTGLILSALALDLLAPPALTLWLLYATPVWLASRRCERRGVFWVVAVCSVLLLGGPALVRGFPHSVELSNRALGIVILWGTAYTISRSRQIPAAMPPIRQEGDIGWQRLQARVQQVKAQTRQLLASQESERRRLARRLHDGISQLLAVICMHLHMAKDLGVHKAQATVDECLRVSEQAIAQVREVSRDLCPSLLDELGLPAALQAHLEDQARRTGLAVNLVACSSLGQLPGELESTCFRVAQAALANTIQQASAQHVQVELRRDAEAVYLTICDDGVGVDPPAVEQVTGEPQEQGLPAMRERVELLGGTCRIEAGPGQGTKIEICLPLDDSLGETLQRGPKQL